MCKKTFTRNIRLLIGPIITVVMVIIAAVSVIRPRIPPQVRASVTFTPIFAGLSSRGLAFSCRFLNIGVQIGFVLYGERLLHDFIIELFLQIANVFCSGVGYRQIKNS
jgi:hypothetical protein